MLSAAFCPTCHLPLTHDVVNRLSTKSAAVIGLAIASGVQSNTLLHSGTASNRSLGRGSVTTALISHALRAKKTDLSNRRDQASVSDTHGCLDGNCTSVLTPADESCQWRSSSGYHWYQVAPCAVKRELPDCTYVSLTRLHKLSVVPSLSKGICQTQLSKLRVKVSMLRMLQCCS